MGWTKREFVVAAYEEIGLASYVYDLQPEQLEAALKRLDAMMATWNRRNIRVGYPLPSSPSDSDLDQEANVPDIANEAIYLNLAARIAPMHGKELSAETKLNALTAYRELLRVCVGQPREIQMPSTMPAGQGNRYRQQAGLPFLDPPASETDLAMNDLLGL